MGGGGGVKPEGLNPKTFRGVLEEFLGIRGSTGLWASEGSMHSVSGV